MFKMNLEKAEESEIKLPRFIQSWRKQENPQKTSTSALLIMPKPLIVWSEVQVAQLCLTLCDPIYYTVHGILQARILEWVAFPFSRGSSQHRERTQVSRIAALPAEPQGKPKDTGVGSLSLLQQIFPTQESN